MGKGIAGGALAAIAAVVAGAGIAGDAVAQAARTEFLDQRRASDPPPSQLRRESIPFRIRPVVRPNTRIERDKIRQEQVETPFKRNSVTPSFTVLQGFNSNVLETRTAPISGVAMSPALKLNFEFGLDDQKIDAFPVSIYAETGYTQFRYLDRAAQIAESDAVTAAAGVKFGHGLYSGDLGYRASIDYEPHFGRHLQTRHTVALLGGWKCNITPGKSCDDDKSDAPDRFINPGFAVRRVFTDPAGSSHTQVELRLTFTQEVTSKITLEAFSAAQMRFYDSSNGVSRRDAIFELKLELRWALDDVLALAFATKFKHRLSTVARADDTTSFATGPSLGVTLKRKF